MPLRVTLLFSVTTDPQDRSAASPHSGGWSESFYQQTNTPFQPAFFQAWAQRRASLLSSMASVTGYRQQLVTLSGNRLLPGGASSGALNVPGNYASLNAPQDALLVYYSVANQPGSVRAKLAALPDEVVLRGEYQPSTLYKSYLTLYNNFLIGNPAMAAITRDLTKPSVRVLSITPNTPTAGKATITTDAQAGVAIGDYVILHRVRDDQDHAVKGSFYVSDIPASTPTGSTYVVNGYSQGTVSKPNGLLRLDVLTINAITGLTPGRLTIRKVGRPFAGYRGRRSKRTVSKP